MMRIICFIFVLFLSQSLSAQNTNQGSQLTDYERFISYPYIEKAYRYQKQGDFQNALNEALHAIERAPNYQPYRQLALELALLLKDLDEILTLIATNNVNEFMLELWLDLVFQSSDPNLISNYLDKLNQQLTLSQFKKREIASRAINRLVGLKYYQTAISMFEQYTSSLGFEKQIIEMVMFAYLEVGDLNGALLHISKYNNVNSEVLNDAYIELILQSKKQPQDILDEIVQIPDQKLSHRAVRAFVQQQIAKSNYQIAIKGFDWLNENDELHQTELIQFLTLLTEFKDDYAIELVKHSLFSCNQKIDTFLKFNAMQLAKDTLLSCLQNSREIYSWSIYARELLTADEMLEMQIDNARILAQLNELAVDKYIVQNNSTELINRLSGNQDVRSLEILLEVYQGTLNWSKGAETAHQLLNLTGNTLYLDIASFLYIQSENSEKAKQLLISQLPFEGTFQRNLHKRLLNLLKPSDLIINKNIFNYLIEFDDPTFVSAELIRASLQCEQAVTNIADLRYKSLNQHRILAICHEDLGNLENSLQSVNHLETRDSSYQIKNMKVNLLYKLDKFEDALSLLETIPISERNESWQLQLAFLHYELKNYQTVISILNASESLGETKIDLLINALLAKGESSKALQLTQKQLLENSNFDSDKWLRQANIYQALGQKQAYIEALNASLRKDPSNINALLALAYALTEDSPQESLTLFQQLDNSSDTLKAEQYEQMAYLSQRLEQNDNLNKYLSRYFATATTTKTNKDKDWGLKRLYENAEKFWEVTLNASYVSGAVLGDVFFINDNGEVSDALPTNNISLRTEYFLNGANAGTSLYGQISSAGTNNNIFGNSAIELGVTYKVFKEFNFKVATGVLKFFENSSDWDGFIKIYGDAFSGHALRRDWRSNSSWYERLFYYDYTYFYDSQQSFGQAFFDYGKTYNISESSYRTLKYYGVIRYDYRKISGISINNKNHFDEISLGLGVRLDNYFVAPAIDDVLDRLSLTLEARFNLAGDLSQDSNGIFVNASYEY